MSHTAIRVDGLSKLYQIGVAETRATSFPEAVMRGLTAPFRAITGRGRGSTSEPHWALRELSLTVRAGEVVGLIGHNGAGKSTLLKILSRITEPTSGEIELRGRVASLLEVGTGFHPELTGRENIFLNGALLGMQRREISRRFDEIVSFAEVERFLDTPVKRYSSGMYTRLAFAVAAHLDPEILLVDEVLAVGDAAFQKKCLGRMAEVSRQGRTVIFVSHSMGAVSRLCQRAIWLSEGRALMEGPTAEVVASYLSANAQEGEAIWPVGISNPGVNSIRVRAVRTCSLEGKVSGLLETTKPFRIELEYELLEPLTEFRAGFVFSTADGMPVFESYDIDSTNRTDACLPGSYRATCTVPCGLLNQGRFTISVNIGIPQIRNLVYLEGVLALTLEDTNPNPIFATVRLGVVRPELAWSVSRLPEPGYLIEECCQASGIGSHGLV